MWDLKRFVHSEKEAAWWSGTFGFFDAWFLWVFCHSLPLSGQRSATT
jgi:hypothetical protein